MSIRIALHHHTRYEFDRTVPIYPHVIRLRPAAHCRTPILSYSLRVRPESHFLNWQQDPFGNFQARVVFEQPSDYLEIDVDLVARMTVINPFDFFLEERAETFPFGYSEEEKLHLMPYLAVEPAGPLVRQWLTRVDTGPLGKRTTDFLVEVNRMLSQDVSYGIRLEPGVQTPEETLGKRSGSCRDSAWLLANLLRHLGLAARFVSGYLVQLAPDVKALDGPSGPESDFTDLHAWTEVYVPGAGWIGLDPTSGLFAGEGHLPLACTPDPESAAPMPGSTGPCQSTLHFANRVERIVETPRVTRPYSDRQWEEIDALGMAVDGALARGDVRLTMGGEPTFVSVDDMDGAEWNTAADGKHKRERAEDLLRRLFRQFAPGGVLHYGEGKWYPGEPLPRWAWTMVWRKDGQPLWRNPARLGAPGAKGTAGVAEAERFAEAVARRLGAPRGVPLAAREDAFYYLWKEGQVPLDDDPLRRDLKAPLERQYLAQLLDRGLGEPVGFAIPVHWEQGCQRWMACPWKLRRGSLVLIPGGSPMGFRLPLDSITAEPQPPVVEPCPLEKRGDLPGAGAEQGDAGEPVAGVYPVPRTALCVEPREGMLRVFFPPAGSVEAWLGLLRVVEETAEELGQAIVLEGYEPPYDPRLDSIKVTPDPGVIEVNIHPSRSWAELRDKATSLYEEARQARLGTEKFMLDGRHSGTGGGNHVTLGGVTPADSPFLRNPGLLRSLLTYWQHHPALSYLFSGLFIGPTSQAPRVDEGRDDRLYELEIAFSQLPKQGGESPWLVDRVLRNLLTDLTGNTHRAEFCIDKLYNPDRSSGRLGLVELRAFEMPPHARMSLVQSLLVRALIAAFWERPYHRKLVRWGTTLHDKFLLPHFVWEDMKQVCADLQRWGFDFKPAWFAPFWEFRFPLFGAVQYEGVEMELRLAMEPWHVLGEEATSQGTARYVDSSVERVEVKVRGAQEERHALLCNGRWVPVTPAGRQEEFVAGIRYKAWSPWSSMHPTIGVHTPLVFELVDRWNERSIGGFTYFVSHPGGRSYETFPVNYYEAEARRVARFWDMGHTPAGVIAKGPAPTGPQRAVEKLAPSDRLVGIPEREEANDEFPLTFDLRFPA